MKLNQKQKKTLVISSLLVLIALITWQFYGGEIFTKTEVLIEKKDELLGTNYKEWKEQFVLGLDYTIGFISVIVLISGALFWKFKTKEK